MLAVSSALALASVLLDKVTGSKTDDSLPYIWFAIVAVCAVVDHLHGLRTAASPRSGSRRLPSEDV